jgi:hypothetical protein
MSELTLRKDKDLPITKLEFDDNMTLLGNRVDLSTNQTINGIKTFNAFPETVVSDNENSSKLANKSFLNTKVDDFLVLAKNNDVINGLITFSSDMTTLTGGDVCSKFQYDKMNKKSIHFSTEYPINPDLSPVALFWAVLDSNNSILDVFQYIYNSWERT